MLFEPPHVRVWGKDLEGDRCMGILASQVKGTHGRATIPAMGALIGEMWRWSLRSEDKKSYTLRADFSDIHELLWEEAGSSLRIELQISREKWYEAKPRPDAKIVRNGRQLTIKGVDLCLLSQP